MKVSLSDLSVLNFSGETQVSVYSSWVLTTDQSTVVTKVQLVETNELKGLAYTVR